jgi:hypothetical protein
MRKITKLSVTTADSQPRCKLGMLQIQARSINLKSQLAYTEDLQTVKTK